MFYQYNNFTGRLVGTTQFQAYNPQGFKQLAKEPPTSIYSAPAASSSAHVTTAASSATKPVPGSSSFYGQVPNRLQQLQKKFQLHNELPVHIKGGGADKALFFFTAGLCVIGIGLAARFIFEKSFPKKAED